MELWEHSEEMPFKSKIKTQEAVSNSVASCPMPKGCNSSTLLALLIAAYIFLFGWSYFQCVVFSRRYLSHASGFSIILGSPLQSGFHFPVVLRSFSWGLPCYIAWTYGSLFGSYPGKEPELLESRLHHFHLSFFLGSANS